MSVRYSDGYYECRYKTSTLLTSLRTWCIVKLVWKKQVCYAHAKLHACNFCAPSLVGFLLEIAIRSMCMLWSWVHHIFFNVYMYIHTHTWPSNKCGSYQQEAGFFKCNWDPYSLLWQVERHLVGSLQYKSSNCLPYKRHWRAANGVCMCSWLNLHMRTHIHMMTVCEHVCACAYACLHA